MPPILEDLALDGVQGHIDKMKGALEEMRKDKDGQCSMGMTMAESQVWVMTAWKKMLEHLSKIDALIVSKIQETMSAQNEELMAKLDELKPVPPKGPMAILSMMLHCGKWGGITIVGVLGVLVWGETQGVQTISRLVP